MDRLKPESPKNVVSGFDSMYNNKKNPITSLVRSIIGFMPPKILSF